MPGNNNNTTSIFNRKIHTIILSNNTQTHNTPIEIACKTNFTERPNKFHSIGCARVRYQPNQKYRTHRWLSRQFANEIIINWNNYITTKHLAGWRIGRRHWRFLVYESFIHARKYISNYYIIVVLFSLSLFAFAFTYYFNELFRTKTLIESFFFLLLYLCTWLQLSSSLIHGAMALFPFYPILFDFGIRKAKKCSVYKWIGGTETKTRYG